MLKKQDDSSDRQLGSKRTEKISVDIGLANVLESGGDSEEDTDRVFAVGSLPGAAVQE